MTTSPCSSDPFDNSELSGTRTSGEATGSDFDGSQKVPNSDKQFLMSNGNANAINLPVVESDKSVFKVKKTKTQPVKKTSFLTISKLSIKLGMTIPKTRVALASKGYLDEHGKATKKALAKEIVKIKQIEDKFNKQGVVDYLLWNYFFLKNVFEKPDEITLFCTVKDRYMALSRFCEAFNIAAKNLSAPSSSEMANESPKVIAWMSKHKLSSLSVEALIECEFNDPNFIGGPFAFTQMTSVSEVEERFEYADVIIKEIHAALLVVSENRAAFFLGVMNGLRSWLLKVVRKN